MSKISVIIPCYNAENWIQETLESVFKQEGEFKLEIIVVDDGSTDRSVDIIESEFHEVNLIQIEKQGPSKARNIGTQESKGQYLQYLDADDLLAPGKLKKQIDLLEKTGADVSYGNWQKLEKNNNEQYYKSDVVRRELISPEIDLFGTFWCPPAVYLFKRSIVEKVGGGNENLPIIQDARFALDCALHGAKFEYVDEVVAYYRVHDSNSVSTRNNISFVKDCFVNACEVESWWIKNGGLTKERKDALKYAYSYVARASFEKDKETFNLAYNYLEKLFPNYLPEKPYLLFILSKLIGYQRAEYVAMNYRNLKKYFA